MKSFIYVTEYGILLYEYYEYYFLSFTLILFITNRFLHIIFLVRKVRKNLLSLGQFFQNSIVYPYSNLFNNIS